MGLDRAVASVGARTGLSASGDNRPYFEGMMWMARTGSQWRHLPDEYGKWNSVFRRYRRWVETGVFDAMLETLAEVVARERSADMSTAPSSGRTTAQSA
jgi:transposase